MKDIAIYGGGGFGKEVASIIYKINELHHSWNYIGFFDDGILKGSKISNYGNVIGGFEILNNWPRELAIILAINNPQLNELIVRKITNPNIYFPNIIHPEVYFADDVSIKMGVGNVIVRGCSFSVDVEIGDFNIFNSLSSLAHDVKVGSYNIFMPLTRVSGEVEIGNFNIFGLNTLILQKLKIGTEVRTAPGTVLLTKPKDGNLYMGNPAKKTIL